MKPREWFVKDNYYARNILHPVGDIFGSALDVRVIERKAYDELEAKLKVAVEALEFYANADHWEKTKPLTYTIINKSDIEEGDTLILSNIGGKRARQALKEME